MLAGDPALPATHADGSLLSGMPMSDNIKGATLMVGSLGLLTVNDAFMKLAASRAPFWQTVFVRGVVATALLAMVTGWQGQLGQACRLSRRDWLLIVLRTVGDTVSALLFLLALMSMPLANLNAVVQTLPLMNVLAAALLFGTPVSWQQSVSIGIGFGSVALIVRPGLEGFGRGRGVVLAVLSVLFMVLRDLTTNRLGEGVSSSLVALVSTAGVTLTAATQFIGLLWHDASSWRPPQPAELGLMALAGVFLVAGQLGAVMTMRVGQISFVMPFRYSLVVWSILIGAAVFDEWPDGVTCVGVLALVSSNCWLLLTAGTAERARPAANADTQPREQRCDGGGGGGERVPWQARLAAFWSCQALPRRARTAYVPMKRADGGGPALL